MSELINIQNGKAVTTSRQVAENFGKDHKHVLRDIENILKDVSKIEPIFFESTAPDSYGREQKIYIMNRDGFTLLAMGFTGSDAIQWKIKYIKAFNEMEKQLNTPQMTQTQIIAAIAQAAAEQEQQLKQIAATQTKQAEELQGMRDVISLDTTSWREDTKKLLNKIANKIGDITQIRELRSESYKLLDSRMGVSLQTRLTNKRRRMADEGICKSSRDKLNVIDVIAEDKKLIEGYTAIIKEMTIKYGC